jgi:rhodanese-related sulfurtransferase
LEDDIMATAAQDTIKPLDAQTLRTWLEQDEALLNDVREPAEFAGERIAGAHPVPLSAFDPARLPDQAGKKLVLMCQTGNRSAQAARKLVEAGSTNLWHLEGGLQAWKTAGFDTERSAHAPLSLQRQVQLVAGSLVLAGTLLGAFASPWFLFLSGFVGAGLVFAGATNTCGLAMLLAKLPYNQRPVCQ